MDRMTYLHLSSVLAWMILIHLQPSSTIHSENPEFKNYQISLRECGGCCLNNFSGKQTISFNPKTFEVLSLNWGVKKLSYIAQNYKDTAFTSYPQICRNIIHPETLVYSLFRTKAAINHRFIKAL